MTGFRQRLTRIRRVVERFPGEGDIYGFQGVTRAMLLDALDGAYDLSQNISEQGSGSFVFELIALKRASSEIYQTYKDILDSEDRTPGTDQFDAFLNDLSRLVEKVQVIYSLQKNGGLQSAEELGAACRQAAEFKKLHDQYAGELAEAEEKQGRLSEILDSAEASGNHLSALSQKGDELLVAIQDQANGVEEASEQVPKWRQAIEVCNQTIVEAEKGISKSASEIERNEIELAEIKGRIQTSQEELQAQAERCKKILLEAEHTLSMSNQVSMAASFSARKKQLYWPLGIWGCVFVGVVTAIALVTCFYVPDSQVEGFGFAQLLPRLAIVSPLVWLGWFAVKQYGFASRLQEEYAYKYAISVAYEGYKKAVSETNQDLSDTLLQLAMVNIAKSPMNVYDKSGSTVKGLPIEEMLESLVRKLPRLTKFSVDSPYGKLTAEEASSQN